MMDQKQIVHVTIEPGNLRGRYRAALLVGTATAPLALATYVRERGMAHWVSEETGVGAGTIEDAILERALTTYKRHAMRVAERTA